jgi:flagellar biosynthesis protein FlhG
VNDQASELRAMAAARAPHLVDSEPSGPPALVIGSGKGGVGKSLVAVSTAMALATSGLRVLLVDGDQNLGNLHVLLGVRPPLTPEALLSEPVAATDLLIEVAPGCSLLPADSGAEAVHRLGPTDRARLHRRMTTLYASFDVVIIDAAAGLDCALRCVTLHATRLVVVTIPEPTSLTDAYALMKIVHARQPHMPFDVIVNRVVDPDEGTAAFSRLATATQRFLARDINYLGAVPEDGALRAAVRDPRTLLRPAQGTAAQRAMHDIAISGLGLAPPAVARAS